VLVAIDFSDASQAARRKAQEWTALSGDELLLLHVDDTMEQAVTDAMTTPLLQISRSRRAEAIQKLRKLESELGALGLKARSLVVAGVPYHSITTEARAAGASMIVLGTQGRTGLSHLLIGSVAERVVREAPCPVLVVPSPPRRKS
jgi:nucleotide-binding universal stress UspA family protein